jgi:hypothetical protein
MLFFYSKPFAGNASPVTESIVPRRSRSNKKRGESARRDIVDPVIPLFLINEEANTQKKLSAGISI